YGRGSLEGLAVSMQSKGNSALTPTLSPGERENISSVIRQPLNGDWIQCAQRRLPLPGEAGWGEGGTHFQLHGYGSDLFRYVLLALVDWFGHGRRWLLIHVWRVLGSEGIRQP